MLKKLYWFTLVLALMLTLVACGSQNAGNPETGVTPTVTDSTGTNNNGGNAGDAAATPTTNTSNLPPLPALSPGGGGGGGGMGGGGGEALSSDSGGIPVEGDGSIGGGDGLDMPIYFENRLENAQFNLNTTLPGAPAPTTVWQQSLNELTQEQIRDFANRLGFTGPIYTDPWYDQFVQDNPGVWPGPRS